MPYQYGNAANPRAHEETTGPEILADCPEIDVFVAGLGTGGTLMGVGPLLPASEARRPDLRRRAAARRDVQGLRSLDEGFVPEIFDPSLLDGKYLVSNRDAVAALRELVVPRGDLRRAVVRGGARRRGAGRRIDGRAARSSRCCPTAAGSTCRPGRTRATSTRWRPTSRAASTGGDAPRASGGAGHRAEVGRLPAPIRTAIVDARPGRLPERGLRHRRRLGTPPPRAAAPLRFAPTRNAAASPYRYEIDPDDLLRLTLETDDADEVVLGDRPLARPLAGPALADRRRPGVLPGRAVHPRVARRLGAGAGGRGRAGASAPGGSSTAQVYEVGSSA